MNRPEEIGYADELLADGTVHRRYENGLEEWRRRTSGHPHLVHWHDNRGASGTDELLGDRIIKRTLADGTATYARDIGYGRTLWARGEKVLVNRSSFGGRMGVLLMRPRSGDPRHHRCPAAAAEHVPRAGGGAAAATGAGPAVLRRWRRQRRLGLRRRRVRRIRGRVGGRIRGRERLERELGR